MKTLRSMDLQFIDPPDMRLVFGDVGKIQTQSLRRKRVKCPVFQFIRIQFLATCHEDMQYLDGLMPEAVTV